MLFPLTMAVFATNQPPGPLGSATPAAYGLAYRNVAFRTAHGVQLSAWYIPARNGAAVLLLPGSGSTRTAVLPQAAVLARHGYGTLLVDTRGHGRSGGHAMDFGWWGDRNISAAMSFLTRRPASTQARSPCSVNQWAASRPWPPWVPTRGSARWSPKARPGSSSPTAAGGRTTSPGSCNAAG
ncbi:MAG TPA: alpha/beta hydrolase [Streptosporangiaceae bacterium]|nr:alpha/beta hydrolase [Streptosporangiaceae bacterium]